MKNYKTLVVAGGIPIDVEPWKKSMNKILAGKAYAIQNREDVAFTCDGMITYIPSIICILNTYFIGRLSFINTVPLNRRNLWVRDGGRCAYCDTRLKTEEVTFEHVIPLGQGGETHWSNIVCSCSICNNKKDNRTPKQAGMKLLRKPTIPRLNKKVVSKVMKKIGFEPVKEESWKGYWDVTLIS